MKSLVGEVDFSFHVLSTTDDGGSSVNSSKPLLTPQQREDGDNKGKRD